MVPPLEIGEPAMDLELSEVRGEKEKEQAAVIDIMGPLSSFHYQVKNVGSSHYPSASLLLNSR